MTTGQRIKQRRKRLGISAEQIAEALGVSPATIYRYEKGDIEKVPGDLLGPIARILKTTPAALMGWEEIEKQDKPTILIDCKLTPEQEELIRLFEAASPATRAGALAMLRAVEAVEKAQNAKEEEK